MTEGPKFLTLDIETSPNLSWHFELYKTNIYPHQVVEPSRIISVAAKWRDSNRVMYVAENFIPDPVTMLTAVRDWLDEADVVITYNGDNFDLPRLNWAFDLYGIARPSPFVSVDLYKLVKREYKRAPVSRSLGYITQQLNLTGKLQHEGYFPLWFKMNGPDPVLRNRAWKVFRRYNKRDVVTTEELFDLLEHLVTNIPPLQLWTDTEPDPDAPQCPQCESYNVQRRGYVRTKAGKYPRFHCQDCGRWSKSPRSEGRSGLR